MKPPHRLLKAIAASVILSSPAPAQDLSSEAAIKTAAANTESYTQAFNKGDAKALAALYAEDAEYSSDAGTQLSGRAAIQKGLGDFFIKNPGATLAVELKSARFLTPDVLVEKGLATIGDELTSYACSYVKKGEAWLITELNETTLAPADAAAVALRELEWLIGDWKDVGQGPSVTANVAWTKKNHFIRRSITVTRDGEDSVDATEVIGYDPVISGLRSWIFDSEGGFGEGTWRREGNKWLVSFTATSPDGSLSTAQHIFTVVDSNKYTWESVNREVDGEVLPNIDKVEVIRAAAP